MNCLTEETVQSFVQRELSPRAEAELHEHCATCAECRQLIAEVARAQFEESGKLLSRRDGKPTIGRYVILEPIGQGGSSIVYAALDPDLGRKIALKLLRSSRASASTEIARGRLMREGRAMALLSHPNVVTVYDVGTWRGQVFVAMELVVGQTLKKWQKSPGRTRAELIDVYLAAGRGLTAAHAAGLVHRDFKPDNVLVGDDGRVLVTDFGLARPVGAAVEPIANDHSPTIRARAALATLTQSGAIVGTPAFMAPEQFVGTATDARTDQFSFCVALYEALYGSRPFSGRTLEELIGSVLRGGAELPPSATEDELGRAILRGLDSKPENRHPSMEALLELLAREQRAPRAHAGPPHRRRRGLVIGAMTLAVTGVAVVAVSLGSAKLEPPESAVQAEVVTTPTAIVSKAVDTLPSEAPRPSSTAGVGDLPAPAVSVEPARSSARLRKPQIRASKSSAAPAGPTATTTPKRGPGSGAHEDSALIADPWKGP